VVDFFVCEYIKASNNRDRLEDEVGGTYCHTLTVYTISINEIIDFSSCDLCENDWLGRCSLNSRCVSSKVDDIASCLLLFLFQALLKMIFVHLTRSSSGSEIG